MTSTYSERFGFDAEHRAAHLALLDLGAADAGLGRRLQDIIGPAADDIVARFYEHLLLQPQARAILLQDEFDLERLKHSQRAHLLTMGIGFDTEQYFEERLRVGMAHAWVGVPVSLYMAAFRILQQLIVDVLPQDLAPAERAQLRAFVLKITALDMSLALETYHLSQVRSLERSLDALRREEAQLRERADTDVLTRLPNRAFILRAITHALAESQRYRSPLCLILADLDEFKAVNDRYGHLVGDAVLRDVSARIKSALRDFDAVGRYGGEEFIIVLGNTTRRTAERIAERVRRRVSISPLNARGVAIDVTLSQGLVVARPGDSAESLIARADAAMYEAKAGGRNRVHVVHD